MVDPDRTEDLKKRIAGIVLPCRVSRQHQQELKLGRRLAASVRAQFEYR